MQYKSFSIAVGYSIIATFLKVFRRGCGCVFMLDTLVLRTSFSGGGKKSFIRTERANAASTSSGASV
jgi:hypothetical protein